MIKQKHYGTIEIDNREKDIVQIWCNQSQTGNVVQLERKNVKQLIKLLEKSINPCQ